MHLPIIYCPKVRNCENCNIFNICVFWEEEAAKLERTDGESGCRTKEEKIFLQDLEFYSIQVNISDA